MRIFALRLSLIATLVPLTMTATARAADTPPPPPAAEPPPAPAAPAPTATATAAPAPATTAATASAGAAPAGTLKGPTIWGMLPWGGVGIGGRVMFPLGISPLLRNPSIRDNFALEVGADLLHWSYDYGAVGVGGFSYSWTEVLPVAGLMWNLWFSDRFALYPKVDLGYAFGWMSGWNNPGPRPTYGGFFVSGDVGALYKFENGIVLRAEAGSSALKLGAGWLF
jgi:hypothetical protein